MFIKCSPSQRFSRIKVFDTVKLDPTLNQAKSFNKSQPNDTPVASYASTQPRDGPRDHDLAAIPSNPITLPLNKQYTYLRTTNSLKLIANLTILTPAVVFHDVT